MNTQSDIHNVLSAISAAQEAFNKVPGLEHTISTLEASLKQSGETIDILTAKVNHQNETIDSLNSTVSTLKGELDEARFQGLLFEEKLGKLQELVKSFAGIVEPPKPEPAPEPVVESPPHVPEITETAIPEAEGKPEQPWWEKPINPNPTIAQSWPGSPEATAESASAPSDGYSPNHFIGWGYGNKPYGMTDARWKELGGGDKPSWMA